jgi:hypothetical protein
MPTPVNFFIKPLSVELQARTLVAHNSRGIAFYITQSGPAGSVNSSQRADGTLVHPLDLVYSLGLISKVQWYGTEYDITLTHKLFANQLMSLAASHWAGGFDFDLHMLKLRLLSMPDLQQWECMATLYRFLNQARFNGNKTERLSIMQQSDKIPADIMLRLETSLATLEQTLLEKDPMMPQHLRNTHSLLISYPETVHLLDDKEIALIIDAAEVHTKTEIIKAAAKGSGAGAGSRKKVSVSEL